MKDSLYKDLLSPLVKSIIQRYINPAFSQLKRNTFQLLLDYENAEAVEYLRDLNYKHQVKVFLGTFLNIGH